jgi:benzil reductase ((S)-benzoin forming)
VAPAKKMPTAAPLAGSPRRLALVTGGSAGLGRALCERLVAEGHRVVEFSRSAPHPFSVHVDFSSPLAAVEIVRDTLRPLAIERWDEVLAVANAGTLSPIGPASRQDPAALLAGMGTNFDSAVLFMAQVVAQFQAHPGRKVVANISSGAALKGYAGWSLYGAAKAGLENFVRALAAEQAAEPHPLRAISIDPGVMDTAMQAAIRAADPRDFPEVARFVRRRDDGELRDPAEVAAAVLRIARLPGLEPGARYVAAEHLQAG